MRRRQQSRRGQNDSVVRQDSSFIIVQSFENSRYLLEMAGYLHSHYVFSLREFGTPVELPGSGGWLLERQIADTGLKDAMGPYPLFCCRDWSSLLSDLRTFKGQYLTVSLVPDTFAQITPEELSQFFQLVRPFKEHFIIDKHCLNDRHITRHHRYYAKRALGEIKVNQAEPTEKRLQEWIRLYSVLAKRHNLSAIQAFSNQAFETQFQVPGLVILRASRQGKAIGMHLWYHQSDVVYSHLSALDEEGYAFSAAYALYWHAIEVFKDFTEVRWIDLGAGAGMRDLKEDGLSRFKRGWATSTRTKYFCGHIADLEAYRLLTGSDDVSTNYFPIYRNGELS